jgi:hypothetical protein
MKPVVVLVVHAAVLVVAALVAFLSAPEGAKATTALVVPGACAAVVLVVAALVAGKIGGEKGRHIGRGVAPVLLMALALLFAWRAISASAPDKAYLRALLWLLMAASAFASSAFIWALRREGAGPGDQSSRT